MSLKTPFGFVIVLSCVLLGQVAPVASILLATAGGYLMGMDW